MPGENRLSVTRIREARERAITALQEHFAQDDLDVDEFERRVTVAHTAESLVEIDALTEDLEPLPGGNAVPAATTALIPAADVRAVQTIRGFMSATSRKGAWTVPRRLHVKAMMSSTILDFREARFPPGPVDVDLRAVMSSIEIIVPPSLAVETDGSAIMGTFDDIDRAAAYPDPDAPLLRIHGLAFMGSVEIKLRLAGESEEQHHHEKRIESRQARHLRRLERLELRQARRADRDRDR